MINDLVCTAVAKFCPEKSLALESIEVHELAAHGEVTGIAGEPKCLEKDGAESKFICRFCPLGPQRRAR